MWEDENAVQPLHPAASGAFHEVVEQEPGASGKIVVAHCEAIFRGSPFEPISQSGKKEVRAISWSTSWRRGRLHLVVGEWTEDWLDEHEAFPTGAHDDQVDSATQGYNYLVSGAYSPGGATIIRQQGSTSNITAAYHAKRGSIGRTR